MRVREGEDVLGVLEARGRLRGLGDPIQLVAEREVRRETSREVGADERSRRAGAEHRPVADVAILRVGAAVGVVRLRQAPDVVVADDRAVALADADLQVQRLGAVVPHVLEPVDAERRLSGVVRCGRPGAELVREIADVGLHHADDVADRLRELQVVTGIPPAAGSVDA